MEHPYFVHAFLRKHCMGVSYYQIVSFSNFQITHCPDDGILPIPLPHPVDLLVQPYHFGRILKQVQLGRSLYQMAEFNPYKSDEHAPVVKSDKQRFGQFYQFMVE